MRYQDYLKASGSTDKGFVFSKKKSALKKILEAIADYCRDSINSVNF